MGKVYVITGATSGIGQSLVEEFSKNSDNIIFAGYRNNKKLPDNIPNNIDYFYIDLSDGSSILKASEYIKAKVKHIDTLINVAGSVTAGAIENIPVTRLKEQFDVNTFSHLEFTQNLTECLRNSKVINISSMSSFGIFPFISPYCASKRALDILFNSFGLENHKNIKVVSVKLGVVSTPIWEKSINSNIEYLTDDNEYSKELEFLKQNALKNKNKGLKVESVAKFIRKIDLKNNVKSSYTFGVDARFAQILSIFPQDLVNKIIKFGLNYRINKSLRKKSG